MGESSIKEFSGDFKIKNEEKDFYDIFYKYKSFIYSGLFYSFGLFLGSSFYKFAQSKILNSIIEPEKKTLIQQLLTNTSLYMTIFLIVMFLGFCLVGYQLLNIIPLIIGFVTGTNIAYFLINYSVKGLGYCVIMIIPYSALFITIIAYTLKTSSEISKDIMDITKGHSVNYQPKKYIKTYLLLGISVVAIAFIKSCFSGLLFDIVTI